MSTMVSEVCDAFRGVGPRDDISEVKGEIVGMRKDIQWLKWAVCGIFLIMLADLAQGFLG